MISSGDGCYLKGILVRRMAYNRGWIGGRGGYIFSVVAILGERHLRPRIHSQANDTRLESLPMQT